MAFTAIQSATRVTGTGATLAITTAATGSGNLVVLGIRMGNVTETCTGVTDDVGNTYVLGSAVNNGTLRMYVAYGVQVTGGATTITASFSGASVAKGMIADEFSGGATTNAAVFDTSSSGTGTSSTTSVTTMTPATSGRLIWAFIGRQVTTGTSGYTLYGGSGTNSQSEYLLSGTTSETCGTTITSSIAWVEIAMAFVPASSPIVNAGFFRFM